MSGNEAQASAEMQTAEEMLMPCSVFWRLALGWSSLGPRDLAESCRLWLGPLAWACMGASVAWLNEAQRSSLPPQLKHTACGHEASEPPPRKPAMSGWTLGSHDSGELQLPL